MLLLSIPFWAVLYGFAAIGLICFAIVNGRQSRIENIVRKSEKGITDPLEDYYREEYPERKSSYWDKFNRLMFILACLSMSLFFLLISIYLMKP